VAAYGYTEAGTRIMIFPHLGAFRFSALEGDPVEADIRPHVDADIVQDTFRRMVVPMVLQVRGHEVLHSSAVVFRDSLVAFCGTSHSGKSTLAYAFSRRGHQLWADDSVALELVRTGVFAVPLPFRIRLRPASDAFFRSAGRKRHLEAAIRVGTGGSALVPLGALFFLQRDVGQPRLEVRQMSPAEAFPVALTHAYCFSLDDPDRKRSTVANYMELVRRVPVHEVKLPPGLDHLERTVGILETTAAERDRSA
jgi:hypothetical protein